MARHSHFDISALREFDRTYDTSHEDTAFQARGDFIRAFPKAGLGAIKLDEYVTGHGSPSFCNYVEAKTQAWAKIQGATASKFGIYFGKTKTDPHRKYRFTRKFGDTATAAFRVVKKSLLDLVHQGERRNLDFSAIDQNPLSQMFKAKILSLYFPDRFLNVCSADHLELLGSQFGLSDNLFSSEYQHFLLQSKRDDPITRSWSNPKFVAFLYKTYIRPQRLPTDVIRKSRKKSHRRVNFEDEQDQRNEIGKAAENYALAWEKERLAGASMDDLVDKIDDRRDRPSYGYDFLSYTSATHPRFIEVKALAKLPRKEGHRFFLSDNEHQVSISKDHRDAYYFYLVRFDSNRKPASVLTVLARDLYPDAEMKPASYTVRFDLERLTND
jgi:hypothetical protein